MRARFRELPESGSWVWSLTDDDGIVLVTSAVVPDWQEAVRTFERATGASLTIKQTYARQVQGPDPGVVRDLEATVVSHVSATRLLAGGEETDLDLEEIVVEGLS